MSENINLVPVTSYLNWDEYFMLQAMMASFKSKDPNTKVGCVFVDDNNHHKHHLRPANLDGIKYTEYIGNSQSVEAHNFIKSLDIKYDIMIIDADHSYEGVKNDTYNFVEFLNKGGMLIFHDTVAVYDINRWFNEMKNNFDFEFIAEFKSNISRQVGIGIFRKK